MKSCSDIILYCRCLLFGLMLLFNAHWVWGKESSDNFDKDKTLFEYLQGQPTEDQLFLGMATLHLNPKSRRIRNWNQNLVGFQFKDFFACTFENSFYKQTWAAGLARNFSTAELSNNWDLTFGYRLGLAYGYQDGQAPFSTISPIIPIVEVYNQYFFRKHYGVELMLTTSISVSLFYQL